MARTRIGAAIATLTVAGIALAGCAGGGAQPAGDNTIDGEVAGDIKVVTWRTDLVEDGTFEEYAKEFNKKYPDVNVTFEGITDYAGEMITRMSTTNYGDVIGIPAIKPDQYEQFLEPLGETSSFEDTYRFLPAASYDGTQYGIAFGGNANGIVYNKKVFEEAGVTDLPTDEASWLEALQLVKDNTDAVPMYTNYKDGWPLTQSFGNLGVITNDPDAPITMAEDPAPWTEGSDVYAIDSLLYDTVEAGLTEEDPLTTNWEQSKVDLGTGKIATMPLGSWAISQMQAAAEDNGASADDIGYMAFPANVDGTQYAVIGGDYNLAVSRHSKAKAAAWAWIQWVAADSGYTEAQGMISPVIDKPLPDNLAGFEDSGVELMEINAAPAGKEGLINSIADDSQIDLYGPLYRQKLVDIARGAADGDKESYFSELNERWGASVEKLG
ncbi:ABC transporter substrate-binding protein [Microbacterium sp. EYE_5]|uniref:ABC transporter substrate-binding protein n=1 Tax=unclassified Microbacterium TaxID=2609290 RepID=UPI0020034DCC|nr:MULTISPECIES: ABC transporter substrate-binding protein [unclassified Microbacterium]MCK6081652.1 ABC transporter substrate-binding protein [Microbacterium sp. EYE_382]MCK6086922.1 ABC transporter substrate-binding protein [Microbacterium sp. EYE_384]MCK6123580.1 ABC transporter substrate-binding protein [Microbacterium sp. EYE_80]MCK6126489.1 ABC transporter substrate-binding protein [Microbacterium sp. EYE_79]MCK6142606.1 ABC transporter substrate-binding protein [Microbacterium sp. EYE_3